MLGRRAWPRLVGWYDVDAAAQEDDPRDRHVWHIASVCVCVCVRVRVRVHFACHCMLAQAALHCPLTYELLVEARVVQRINQALPVRGLCVGCKAGKVAQGLTHMHRGIHAGSTTSRDQRAGAGA